MDNVPQQKDDKKGTVRDIIASKVGIGSGRTYERAKSAIKIIEKPFFPHEEQDNAILHRLIAAKRLPTIGNPYNVLFITSGKFHACGT